MATTSTWTLTRLYVSGGKLRAQVQRTLTLPDGSPALHTHTTALGPWGDWGDKALTDIIAALAAKLMPADTPLPPSWTLPAPIAAPPGAGSPPRG